MNKPSCTDLKKSKKTKIHKLLVHDEYSGFIYEFLFKKWSFITVVSILIISFPITMLFIRFYIESSTLINFIYNFFYSILILGLLIQPINLGMQFLIYKFIGAPKLNLILILIFLGTIIQFTILFGRAIFVHNIY